MLLSLGTIIEIKLDFALTAMMLYVLVILIDSRIKLIIAIIAITLGVVLQFTIKSDLDIFISTLIATGVGVWLKKKI